MCVLEYMLSFDIHHIAFNFYHKQYSSNVRYAHLHIQNVWVCRLFLFQFIRTPSTWEPFSFITKSDITSTTKAMYWIIHSSVEDIFEWCQISSIQFITVAQLCTCFRDKYICEICLLSFVFFANAPASPLHKRIQFLEYWRFNYFGQLGDPQMRQWIGMKTITVIGRVKSAMTVDHSIWSANRECYV